jgi:hypothetical protein
MYDDLIVEHAVSDLQKTYGFKVPSAFWQGREQATFGEIVDGWIMLISARAA